MKIATNKAIRRGIPIALLLALVLAGLQAPVYAQTSLAAPRNLRIVSCNNNGTCDSGETCTWCATDCGTCAPSDALYVDPNSGSDSNSGSEAGPWRSLQHAFSKLGAGDVLVLREGHYDAKDLDLDASGTASDPITIRNYPGEQPVIDGSYPEFRTAGNDAWELVDSSIHLYRSKATYGSGVFVGKMLHQGSYYNLVTYSDTSGNGMANISSTKENVSTGARYAGPGMYNDSGRLYIRLQPHSAEALHGRVYDIPSNKDPRANALFICNEQTVLNIRGSYINIHGVDVVFGRYGFRITSSADHINITGLTVNVPTMGIDLDDGVHDVTIDGVTFEGSFPPWVAWTDMKGGDGQSVPARHWSMKTGGVSGSYVRDIEIKNSRFNRVFDGSVMEGNNIHIHHNEYVVLDDMIQLGSNSYDIEIDHNYILGAGPSHNGKGSSPYPGRKYIHHNIIEADIDMLWGKNDPSSILRSNYSGWIGQIAFPTHTSSNIGNGDPWKIYHNTIFFNGSKRSGGVGADQWSSTNSTGEAHEVYNNILVEIGGGVLAEDMSTRDGFQIYDGNLYYRQVSSSRPLWGDIEGSSGTRDFDSLEEFIQSSTFEDSKQMISTGWEANGIEADPELDSGFYPSATGPAASGAIPLPSSLPGPRHAHRGALAPR